MSAQLDLFGRGQPQFDPAFSRLKREHLAGAAWLDIAPGWLQGHQSLFDSLRASTRFRSERRLMYERVVEVPRLYAVLGEDGPIPALVNAMQRALSERYQEQYAIPKTNRVDAEPRIAIMFRPHWQAEQARLERP